MIINKLFPSVSLTLSVVALFMVATTSCTQEDVENRASCSANSVQIMLSVPQNISRATTTVDPIGDESYIKDVRVLFFKKSSISDDWILERNETKTIDVNGSDVTAQIITIQGVTRLEDERSIYVIANWQADVTDLLEVDVTTEASFLANSITRIAAPILAPTKSLPLVMYGAKKQHIFANGKAIISLTRQVTKIQLTVKLSADFSNLGVLDNSYRPGWSDAQTPLPATHPTVHLQNIPNAAYVSPTNEAFPANYELMAYENVETTSSATEFLVTGAYYVLPNWVKGSDDEAKSVATTVQLQLPLKLSDGTVVTDNYYTIPVKTTAFDDDIYSIRPNYVYDVLVSVNGFGSETNPNPQYDLDVIITVQPWSVVTQNEERGSYVRILDVIASISGQIESGDSVYPGESVLLTCVTNIGEWYTITTNQLGTILHSTELQPTEPVVVNPGEREHQSVTVYIPDNEESTSYAINLYQNRFTTKETGPLRTFELKMRRMATTYIRIEHYGGAVVFDNDKVNEDGETLTAYCSTNRGEWWVNVTSTNGTNITAKAPQTPWGMSEQALEFKIPATTSFTKYTITVYDRDSTQLKTLVVFQRHGVILNAELNAGGWTKHSGSTGLQMAKRGNVPPTGSAGSERQYIWGPSYTSAAPTPNTPGGLGDGLTDTQNLARLTGYEAAKACTAMSGGSWFLPSGTELDFISGYNHAFSSNYSGEYGAYWSSSAITSTNAFAGYLFPSGSRYQTLRGTPLYVRCAKYF